jgi:hypothetical protein
LRGGPVEGSGEGGGVRGVGGVVQGFRGRGILFADFFGVGGETGFGAGDEDDLPVVGGEVEG